MMEDIKKQRNYTEVGETMVNINGINILVKLVKMKSPYFKSYFRPYATIIDNLEDKSYVDIFGDRLNDFQKRLDNIDTHIKIMVSQRIDDELKIREIK